MSQPNYPEYPNYPGHQAQPYPNAQQAPYPYPAQFQQAPYYPGSTHQPFPPPIQQQPPPSIQGAGFNWYQNTNFQSYLTNASAIHVEQKVELLEAITGWEQENKYTVKDHAGNKMFYAAEDSNLCARQFLSSSRPFSMTIKDRQGATILMFDRGIACDCCCGLLCPDVIDVRLPSGPILGSVKQNLGFTCCFPSFSIRDSTERTHLTLEGPCLPMACCGGRVQFKLKTPTGASVGVISKEWGGLVREYFTDADSFYMSFPQDLDPSLKAVCLAALFLVVSIDF